jgi:hypothetical protein
VEDKKVAPSLPKLPPGSEEAFKQAEEERQRRIESLRSQGSKGDKRKELELTFIEDTHTYYMKDLNGEIKTNFPSVSKVLKKFYEEFDSENA